MHVRLTLNGLTSARIAVGDDPDELAGYVTAVSTTLAVRLIANGQRPRDFSLVELRDLYTEVVLSTVLSAVLDGQPVTVGESDTCPIPIRVDPPTSAPTPPAGLTPTMAFIYAINAGFWRVPSLELSIPGDHNHTLWATDFSLARKESPVGRLQRSLKIPRFSLWVTCGGRDDGFVNPLAAEAEMLHALFCEHGAKILPEP